MLAKQYGYGNGVHGYLHFSSFRTRNERRYRSDNTMQRVRLELSRPTSTLLLVWRRSGGRSDNFGCYGGRGRRDAKTRTMREDGHTGGAATCEARTYKLDVISLELHGHTYAHVRMHNITTLVLASICIHHNMHTCSTYYPSRVEYYAYYVHTLASMQTVMHTKGVLLIASTTSVKYNIISNMLTVIYASNMHKRSRILYNIYTSSYILYELVVHSIHTLVLLY